MMLLNHFPKLISPLNLSKTRLPNAFTLYCTSKSSLSFSESIEIPNDLVYPEETQIEIPIEKLFIPPETDISSGSAPLSKRVLRGSNIVLSKYARDAQVSQAEFVKSCVTIEDCKTQCINHFRINDSWFLVDLPGYGFANVPHEVRTDWSKFTKDYFLNRSTLVSVFLLIDASIPAKKIDLEYASWTGQNQIPMTLIFTKFDKRKKKKHDFQDLIREYFQSAPPWIMTSSITNQGRDEMLLHMAQLRNYWFKH
ncbi:hypothetical protein MKX01_037468 [Papaver californicum]|nr:hypothetical protein MKX01_037468 [Papaver californicum]